MRKIKKYKIAIVATLIFSMVAIYGSVPTVKAVSLDLAKDTISDSSPSSTGVSHTILFDLGTALTAGQYIDYTFETGIVLTAATTTCPLNMTGSVVSAQVLRCTVDSGQTLASSTATSTIVVDTVNPANTGDYSVTISSHQVGGVEIESSEMKVYIIDEVTVTAHVPATLTFTIGTTTPSQTLNGEAFHATSSPTTIPFGTLDTSEILMGQELKVSTNADDGFNVTVQQDGNLRSGAAADIDSFSPSAAIEWAAPSPDIDDENTWGHMGVTSDDSGVFTTSDTYRGLDGTEALSIFSHDGPTNSTGTGTGTAIVGYKIQVSAMQEAGDYQNILTYICTPTY